MWLLRGPGVTRVSGHGEGQSDGIMGEQQPGWGRGLRDFLFLFFLHQCQADLGGRCTGDVPRGQGWQRGGEEAAQPPCPREQKPPAVSGACVPWEPVLPPLQRALSPPGTNPALTACVLSVAPCSPGPPGAVAVLAGALGTAGLAPWCVLGSAEPWQRHLHGVALPLDEGDGELGQPAPWQGHPALLSPQPLPRGG